MLGISSKTYIEKVKSVLLPFINSTTKTVFAAVISRGVIHESRG